MHKILRIIFSPIINFFPKGFPLKKLLPLLFLQFCESFINNSIGSYSAFMVKDFGIVNNNNDAGYYSGLLNSCYFLAQFLSSFFLGTLSDSIGRKPVLIIGSIGSIISTLLFGFSFDYWWAVMTRSINGFVNGNVGVVKTLLGELSTKSNRAQIFGMTGIISGLGMMTGAGIGGYLARPCIQYPNAFEHISFFQKFPYILPNLLAACMTSLALICCCLFIEETKEIEKDGKKCSTATVSIFVKVIRRIIRIVRMLFGKEYLGLLCCASYIIVSFGSNMKSNVTPLLMMASPNVGGYGWDTSDIGTFFMISAVGIILSQLFFYRPVVHFCGLLWTNRIGSILNIILYNIPPLLYYTMNVGDWLLWTGIVVYNLIGNMSNQFCFSSVMAMVANSVTSDVLGALNGLSQSLVALFRLIAPLVSSPIMAWSLGNEAPWNAHFTFFIISLVPLVNLILLIFIPKSINQPREFTQPKYQTDKEFYAIDDDDSIDFGINGDVHVMFDNFEMFEIVEDYEQNDYSEISDQLNDGEVLNLIDVGENDVDGLQTENDTKMDKLINSIINDYTNDYSFQHDNNQMPNNTNETISNNINQQQDLISNNINESASLL